MKNNQAIIHLIQSHKAIDHFDYTKAVDWAIDLIRQGKETDNILMLASFAEPINRFEISPYVSAVLRDFELPEYDYEGAVIASAHYYLSEILDDKSIRKNLDFLAKLCVENKYNTGLMNFYLLYFAWEDLEDGGVSYHYDGVNLNNIEAVLKKEAISWIDKYVNGQGDLEDEHVTEYNTPITAANSTSTGVDRKYSTKDKVGVLNRLLLWLNGK